MKQILVVDDAKISLMQTKTALGAKYHVTAVTDGTSAIAYLAAHECDLILLDYKMPEMSGAEVFEKLRANPKTKEIPVVFLTGNDDFSEVTEILAKKPAGYLLKPVAPDELLRRVEELIG